jgi:hypothetical protein
MSVKINKLIAIGLFSLTPACLATTIAVAVTPEGIVIAADGGERGHTRTATFVSRTNVVKFVPVQKRLIVAAVGITDISWTSDDGARYEYHFDDWINKLQRELPADVTPEAMASKIADEGAVIFEPYNERIRKGKFKYGNNPTEKFKVLIEYVILGYSLEPRIFDVQFFIDWDQQKVLPPKTVRMYPLPGIETGKATVTFFSFGISQAIDDRDNPASYAYGRLKQCQAFRDLQAGKWDGLSGIAGIVETEIKIEETVNPSMVFGDISATIITPTGTLIPVTSPYNVLCPPLSRKDGAKH